MTSRRSRFGAGRTTALVVALTAGAASGCSDTTSTSPLAGGPAARLVLTESDASGFQLAVEDLRSRVVPGLAASASRGAIAPLLDGLAEAVRRRDGAALRRGIARASDLFDGLDGAARVGGDAAADAPELGALRLVLDQARALATADASTTPR